jgi:hypothetical protein
LSFSLLALAVVAGLAVAVRLGRRDLAVAVVLVVTARLPSLRHR